MTWRANAAQAKTADGAHRKAAMRSRVRDGVPIGILGYQDNEPVAWCSIAPRDSYRPLGATDDAALARENVWSLVCMFIKRPLRGQALGAELVGAAVAMARKRGATVIEAYPVDPDSPSYRFMGFVSLFAKLGFEEVGRAGSRRHIVRLRLKRSAQRRRKSSR